MREKLLQLGLSEKEVSVLLTLIRLGPTPASILAKSTQIKRTSIYDVLSSLSERNLLSSFKQNNIHYFYVDDIKKLVVHEREQLKIAEALVEELKHSALPSPLHFTYYKGREGIKELYNDILAAKPKELIGWMNLDEFYQQLDADFEEDWTKKRIQSGMHVRLILHESPLTHRFQKKDPQSNRETRFIQGPFPFKSSCLLYEPYITFFNPRGDIAGVRLQSQEFFELQKAVFEMNWKILK